jgi:hypothetical protein
MFGIQRNIHDVGSALVETGRIGGTRELHFIIDELQQIGKIGSR